MTAAPLSPTQTRLLAAIEPHVIFDGWSEAAFDMAARDCDLTPEEARAACPRGALDLAVAYHRLGDAEMLRRFAGADPESLRYSERVALAVKLRLQVSDREVVRRGMTLFALPHHAAEGAALMWGTADAIWTALGDTSTDGNWYSKRAILAGVISASVLYWLGDAEGTETDAFVDRRIADVMTFEKMKAGARKNPLLAPFAKGLGRVMAGIRAPGGADDLPGRWTTPE